MAELVANDLAQVIPARGWGQVGTGAHLDLLGVDDWRVTGFSPTTRGGATGLRLRRRRLTLDDQRRDRHARRRAPRSPDIDVEVVQIATSRVLQNHVLHGAPVTGAGGVAFGPAGRGLVAIGCCGPGSTVAAWDARTRGQLFSDAGDQATAFDLAPRSALLGVATQNGKVLFLDPRTGRQRRRSKRPPTTSTTSRFRQPGAARRSPRPTTPSASGTCAPASASATRSVLTALIPVTMFEPDGRLLIVLLESAVQSPTDVQTWERFACQVAGRDLTRAEWHDLLPTQPHISVCP